MALSWLSAYSPQARTALPGIIRGVREGLSATAIGRALRDGGLSFSNAFLFEAARRQRAVQTAGGVVALLGDDERPDPSSLPEALTAIRRRYAFYVEVEGRSALTGERVTRNVTISTNRLLTRSQIEDAALEAVESAPEVYGLADVEATAFFGVKAGPLGTL